MQKPALCIRWCRYFGQPLFGPDTLGLFDLRKAMERRNMTGAPGSREVKKQLARWQKKLA